MKGVAQESSNPRGASAAAMASFEARVGAHTDPGQVRSDNEDRLLMFDIRQRQALPGEPTTVADLRTTGLLLMVADGMGGMSGGEQASQMCVDSVPEFLLQGIQKSKAAGREALREALAMAVKEANRRIFGRAAADVKLRGMGCTLTAMLLDANHALIAQVGDSRAYLCRNGQIKQLTLDQTVWESLRAAGKEAEAALGASQFKSMLMQAVGAQEAVEPVLSDFELQAEDWLVLCSDGLHRCVNDEQIREILGAGSEPAEKARALTTLANKNGGPDNVSVVVCQLAGKAGVGKGAPVAA